MLARCTGVLIAWDGLQPVGGWRCKGVFALLQGGAFTEQKGIFHTQRLLPGRYREGRKTLHPKQQIALILHTGLWCEGFLFPYSSVCYACYQDAALSGTADQP